ncbi:MAG: type transport system permease protein [Pseudonocardiales bacterium]|jgi:ABC-2 type transport system permease protein|nr:type transport system permease protein [Pseudonocardiales bacterium]
MSTHGAAPGYRTTTTLPLRVELVRQLRRRRTVLALGLLVLLPFLLWLAFRIGRDDRNRAGGATLADLATASGLNFVMFTLFSTVSFLLVVVVALFFGDTVASEASWSSLRYLLAAPVPRGRLLRQKAVVAALLSVCALVLLPAVAMAVGVVAYGAGDLVSPTGQSLAFLPAAGRLALVPAYLALQLAWVAGLALLLSVSTDAPLGAVGGAVMVSILSQILETINALGDLRDYLPTRFNSAWADLLASPIDWTQLASGAFSGLAYATVFGLAAWWRFATKDITS